MGRALAQPPWGLEWNKGLEAHRGPSWSFMTVHSFTNVKRHSPFAWGTAWEFCQRLWAATSLATSEQSEKSSFYGVGVCRARWNQQSRQGIWGFPDGSVVNNPPANAGDAGLIPGSGRSPGVGNSTPLQYSCLENPMDREAWRATVQEVAQSRAQLNN